MKKQSKSQRIGSIAEDQFRVWARLRGLIPVKVPQEDDFGFDFFCNVTGPSNKRGVAPVLGTPLLAFVRASEKKPGKIKFTRDDAESLLACANPACVVFVEGDPRKPKFYYRFVDEELCRILAEFLRSSRKKTSIASKRLLTDEKAFEANLQTVTRPGYVERVRIALCRGLLADVLPKFKLEVRRTPEGSLALVHADRFEDIFDAADEVKTKLHSAVFGAPALEASRFAELPLKPEIVEAFKLSQQLPEHILLAGPSADSGDATLVVTGPAGRAECSFLRRSTRAHHGFVHESGLALTISTRTEHNGQYVHFLDCRLDDAAPIELAKTPDLWTFLEKCVDGAKLGPKDDPEYRLGVEQFGSLRRLALFARVLRELSGLGLSYVDGWHLQDSQSDEDFTTLEWLAWIATKSHRILEGKGFYFADEDVTKSPAQFRMPVVANARCGAFVAWFTIEGFAYLCEERIAGLEIGAVLDSDVTRHTTRFAKKTIFPEAVIHSEWPTLVLDSKLEFETYDEDPKFGCMVDMIDIDEDTTVPIGRSDAKPVTVRIGRASQVNSDAGGA